MRIAFLSKYMATMAHILTDMAMILEMGTYGWDCIMNTHYNAWYIVWIQLDLEYKIHIPFCNFRYNRQFRYEERNGAGHLKGRYGFFDKYGELKVVNYSADPYAGFHAEGAGVPEYPHWSCSNCICLCNRLILLCRIKITQRIINFTRFVYSVNIVT